MPNCGPTTDFMEQILWVRMRWGGRVMVSSPATGYPFFPLWLWKSCDSAWWPREDIKMAVWDMLTLVSQLSFWKHKRAVAQAFNDTSVQPNCFSGLMLQRREWDQTGSSVWQGALRRSGGPWTNDPAKCITSSCYHPALSPPLTVMIHDEFCRFVGCKSEKEIKLHLTLCSVSPLFSNDFCVTYVQPDV